ncbi:MAG: nitroreductase [Deltaproteobacteria bacterium HGW-Deltaproteobacteria-9]|nr:MAG: nitroreductase [Deltaproteobacteria bacterium HGW-Deltaproteobacteria-9]
MDLAVNTIIDSEKCIGCGLCVKVCPYETLSLVDGKARVTGDKSLNCGHCVAVCPVSAVSVTTLEPLKSLSFIMDNEWIKHGLDDTGHLAQLMASRRSCRNFKDKPVDRNILEDLTAIGTTAPSGSNSQEWTFTIIPNRAQVEVFGEHVLTFLRKLNRMARIAPLRRVLSLLGKDELEHYYERYSERMEELINNWETKKKDMLFHDVQALILVGATKDASCPQEDALLATQNIMLAAHAMGLGTCLIGFAVAALMRDQSIGKALGLARGETIYSVIAVGWPDERYSKIIPRKKIIPRYTNLSS